jgi:hypothetical protein
MTICTDSVFGKTTLEVNTHGLILHFKGYTYPMPRYDLIEDRESILNDTPIPDMYLELGSTLLLAN